MSIPLRKYGVAATIDGIVLITRGAIDFQANPTLAAGDVQISKDGGAFANVTTRPTVSPAAGTSVQITLSVAEMTAARIAVRFIDTATKEWEDNEIIIETYGNAAAQHPFDLGLAEQLVALSATGQTDVAVAVDAVLNTAIPGSPAADSVYERVQTLDDNYTAARAANLDNLDAAVTSRSSHNAAAIWDVQLEGTVTAKQMMRVGLAALAGEATGLDLNAPVYKDIVGATKDRITAATDAFGNRSSVTFDFSDI